jgi:fido (protein-threonine AMPylation protein)
MNDWQDIDGATPVPNREFLKDRSIETRAQLIVVEAENVRKAHVKYLGAVPSKRTAPFVFSWSLRLHQEMLGDVWLFAGQIRKGNINLGVAPYQIQPMLFELLSQSLPFWKAVPSMSALEVAARLHHEAVKIHPFLDGNGRWSRMLANIWLKQHGEPIVDWPAQYTQADAPIRQEYLRAVRNADDGDFDLLVELHARYQAS